MTVTFLAWITVASRVALAGVRLPQSRRRPAVVPVPRSRAGGPPPGPADTRAPEVESWRPRVSSGCGR